MTSKRNTTTTAAATASAEPVEAPATVTSPKQVTRPKTCGDLAVSGLPTATFGSAGCKRLPRHGGEHRAQLTVAALNRVTKAKAAKAAAPAKAAKFSIDAYVKAVRAEVGKPRGRLTVTERKAALTYVMAQVEAGKLAANDGLAVAGRLQ